MVDVDQWLEQWVEAHLNAPGRVEEKSEMHDEAKICAEEAKATGISVVDLKQAAGGDLEAYLVTRQNILTTRHRD